MVKFGAGVFCWCFFGASQNGEYPRRCLIEGKKCCAYMSHNLNSLKGGDIGDYIGDYYGGYQGDTRSLDGRTYELYKQFWLNLYRYLGKQRWFWDAFQSAFVKLLLLFVCSTRH